MCMTCCVGRQTCYAHLPAPRSCIKAGSQSVFPSYWGAPTLSPEGLSSLPVTLGGPPSAGYESADFPGCSSPTSNGQLPTLWPGTPAQAGHQASKLVWSVPGCGLDLPSDPRARCPAVGSLFPFSSNFPPSRPARSVPGIRGNWRTAWAQTGSRGRARCG